MGGVTNIKTTGIGIGVGIGIDISVSMVKLHFKTSQPPVLDTCSDDER